MPQTLRMSDLGPRPDVRTSDGWGKRARVLNSDPRMQRVTFNHWVRFPGQSPVAMTSAQRAALMQTVLDRPSSAVRVTGLSALSLYGLPVAPPDATFDRALGHRPADRAHDYAKMLSTVHLSWSGQRMRTPARDVFVSKSYGLDRFPGPWGARLADPVEALVVAAPYLSRWRLTACLDTLVFRSIRQQDGHDVYQYDRTLIRQRLGQLPPTSPRVHRVTTALADVAENTWSPRETLTRLLVMAHDLPAPVMNFRVVLDGTDRYLDLAWPHAKVAVEYNGADHTDRRLYGDELFRRQRLEDSGWKIRFLVLEDLLNPARRALWLEWLATELTP